MSSGQTNHTPISLRGLLAVLMAFALALRVIAAPLVLSAPSPGLMAICSGGDIYYVTLDGTPVDGEPGKAKPCPFAGMTLTEAGGPVHPVAFRPVVRVAASVTSVATAPARLRDRAHGPRAPPLSRLI